MIKKYIYITRKIMNIYNNFIEQLFEYNLYTISKKIFITYLTLENSSLDCY